MNLKTLAAAFAVAAVTAPLAAQADSGDRLTYETLQQLTTGSQPAAAPIQLNQRSQRIYGDSTFARTAAELEAKRGKTGGQQTDLARLALDPIYRGA
jgi:hypothetical protein